MRRIVLLLLAILAVPSPAISKPIDLYVTANKGNDKWNGSKPVHGKGSDGPLATLDGARDRLRKLAVSHALPNDGAVVHITGTFSIPQPFTLTKEDDFGKPVVYQGMAATVTGGKPVTGWDTVDDTAVLNRLDKATQDKVYVTSLPDQDINDYGSLTPRGFGRPNNAASLELFYNDIRMTLARWPNAPLGRNENNSWTTVASVPAGANDRFVYSGDRPSRWASSQDVWVHGYFKFDWADSYNQISQIDTDSKTIVITGWQPPFGYEAGHRWYAVNILEELDSPGEYYLDRNSGKLYFWPPAGLKTSKTTVSMANNLLVLKDVSHTTFRNIIFDQCRSGAIIISGGDGDSIEHCNIRNAGSFGIDMSGSRHIVDACTLENLGEGGVIMSGGNRQTLTPGANRVSNCIINRYSLICRTYCPGVQINGVGNNITHNHIYNAPHEAIALSGNDHVISNNEIDHVCMETGDAGAVYMGRNWTMRGNVITGNYFHDIGRTKGLTGYSDTMAVYLDDTFCGVTITDNLFVRASHAIQIGGGRDNTVNNNVFIDCSPAVSLDDRGLTWAAQKIGKGGDWNIQQSLAEVPYNKPPYSVRYPTLPSMPTDNPGLPKGNVIQRNIVFRCPKWLDLAKQAEPGLLHKDNLVDTDPLFINLAKGDYRLNKNSPAYKLGFHNIPVGNWGPK